MNAEEFEKMLEESAAYSPDLADMRRPDDSVEDFLRRNAAMDELDEPFPWISVGLKTAAIMLLAVLTAILLLHSTSSLDRSQAEYNNSFFNQ